MPGARRALDLEQPVERRDAIGDPAQAAAGAGVRAADAVVAHLDHDAAVLARDRDLRLARAAYLATLVSASQTRK